MEVTWRRLCIPRSSRLSTGCLMWVTGTACTGRYVAIHTASQQSCCMVAQDQGARRRGGETSTLTSIGSCSSTNAVVVGVRRTRVIQGLIYAATRRTERVQRTVQPGPSGDANADANWESEPVGWCRSDGPARIQETVPDGASQAPYAFWKSDTGKLVSRVRIPLAPRFAYRVAVGRRAGRPNHADRGYCTARTARRARRSVKRRQCDSDTRGRQSRLMVPQPMAVTAP